MLSRHSATSPNRSRRYCSLIADADRQLQEWWDKYNNVRPHSALGMKCPGEIYVPSERAYNEIVKPYEYSGEFRVIKVNSWDYIRFGGWKTYQSETMIDELIEIRPDVQNDSFDLCYRYFRIAAISAETGKLIHRRISRL